MTFETHSLLEIIQSAFTPDVWGLVWPAFLDTMYMVALASLLTFIGGVLIGIILYTTHDEGLTPLPTFYNALSSIVNALRSLPSLIMIIIILPVARTITGKGYGMPAVIIALTVSCVPMYARLVENSLLSIERGKVEAALSMGSGHLKILSRVIIPETLTQIIRGFIVAIIAIISMTAIAGSFGAGGLGNIAVQYGFNRFRYDIMLITVILLIVVAQVIQWIGDLIARMILKKRHKI